MAPVAVSRIGEGDALPESTECQSLGSVPRRIPFIAVASGSRVL